MKVLSRIYIFVLVLLSMFQLRLANASQYEIQLFRQYVSEFDRAQSQYQSAPSGSYQEQMADRQRREQAQYAQNIIRAPNTFQGMSAQENEMLLQEFQSNYQSSSSGSIREQIFNVARAAAGDGLQINALAEIQNAYDYKDALQRSLSANTKYQNASSGSIIERVYNVIRRQGFEISKQKLNEYAQYQLADFRQAEQLFVYLNQQCQASSSGSLVEDFYNSGRRVIQMRTLDLFRAQASMISYNELRSIESEYSSKYQGSSSGSLAESLYRSIRDEARARLGSVPPTYPNPNYPPQPPQSSGRCQVMQGANASGQVLYRVLDQAGRVLATVFSYAEAVQISQNDLRCR